MTKECSVQGCNKKIHARGMCNMHATRLRRTGKIGPAEMLVRHYSEGTVCEVEDCENLVDYNSLCPKHWARLARHGDTGIVLRVWTDMSDYTEDQRADHKRNQETTKLNKRRAIKRNAFVDDIDRQALYNMYEGLCYLCWSPTNGDWHLEHIIPLSRGGLHCWENVAVSCQPCNQRKFTKTFAEFVYTEGGFSFYGSKGFTTN